MPTFITYYQSTLITKIGAPSDYDPDHFIYKTNYEPRYTISLYPDTAKVDDFGSDVFTIKNSGSSQYLISMEGISDDDMNKIICNTFTRSDKLSLLHKMMIMRTCARPSATDDDKIAYYPSDKDRIKKRLVKIKPGRFLKKLFKDALSDDIIESLANEWLGENTGFIFKILTKGSEIKDAYINGPRSCMSDNETNYRSYPYHPCEVYGTSDEENEYDQGVDTALAVLLDGNENILARSLVDKKAKVYAHSYGDYQKIHTRLIKEGYTHTNNFPDSRMRLIYGDNGIIVCPYLDVSSSVGIENGYLVIGGGEYDANYTNGTVEPTILCEFCNNVIEDGDENTHQGCIICPDCLDERTFYCPILNDTCNIDDDCSELVIGYIQYNGCHIYNITMEGIETLCDRGVLFQCAHDDYYYPCRSHTKVETLDKYGDEVCYELNNFYNYYGFYCSFSNEYCNSFNHTCLSVNNNPDDPVHVSEELTSEIIADLNSKEAHRYISWLKEHDYVDPRIDDFVRNQTEMELVVN